MVGRLAWTPLLGALVCGCAGHGTAAQADDVQAAPAPSSTSMEEAIRMTNVAIPECISDSFTAEERNWDGATWWNVSCRTGHTLTSIENASSWVRQHDGHFERGGRWTASTQPDWLGTALDYPAQVAIERAQEIIGDGAQLDCDRDWPLLLHAFSLACTDRTSGRLFEVVVDPRTGEVHVGPNPVELLVQEMRAKAEQ